MAMERRSLEEYEKEQQWPSDEIQRKGKEWSRIAAEKSSHAGQRISSELYRTAKELQSLDMLR